MTLLSIPRDPRVPIPGHGEDKINSAFAIGGPALMKQTVEQFLGIPVHFYFVMYIQGFEKVIDAMGGVDINVEKRLHYNDNAGNLHINLQPGMQHLNGYEAMGFARFRHDATGDFGRIGRQQAMLNALGRKALSVGAIRGLPTLFEELLKKNLIVTNLSLNAAYKLKGFYNDEVRQNTKMFMFPGVPQTIGRVSYVIPDLKEIPYVVNGIFNEGGNPKNHEIKIELKNGCGYRGVAEDYARRLGYFGFDVLGTSNADSFDYDHSIVVVYKPNAFDKAVSRIMNAEIVNNPNSDAIPHMDVIVGRDKLHFGN
jgi:polyisoprenyl-teichoic acid--peptidoglycan teichoic acid transferase